MSGSRELLEPLPVSGELVELLPVEPLGELQVRGPRGDLVLLASDTDDRVPIRLTLDSDQGAIAALPDLDITRMTADPWPSAAGDAGGRSFGT